MLRRCARLGSQELDLRRAGPGVPGAARGTGRFEMRGVVGVLEKFLGMCPKRALRTAGCSRAILYALQGVSPQATRSCLELARTRAASPSCLAKLKPLPDLLRGN
jgi:hypothetical protein